MNEMYISMAVAVLGIIGTVLGHSKYVALKATMVETVGDIADLLAMIYAVAKKDACDESSLKLIAAKIEEIWTDLDARPSKWPTF